MAATPDPVDVTFRGLTFTVQPRGGGPPVEILKGLSGAVRGGRCLAIMGASGAGKVGTCAAGNRLAAWSTGHWVASWAGADWVEHALAGGEGRRGGSARPHHRPTPTSHPPSALLDADHPAGRAGGAHVHGHSGRPGPGQRPAPPPQALPAHQVRMGPGLGAAWRAGACTWRLWLPTATSSRLSAAAAPSHPQPCQAPPPPPPPLALPFRPPPCSSYVQQRDVLMASATVREAVTTAALLKLPRDMAAADKRARVDDVLADLDLQGCQVGWRAGGAHPAGLLSRCPAAPLAGVHVPWPTTLPSPGLAVHSWTLPAT